MSSEELNDLKTILNSLVIPNPNGLSLRHLCNDYRDLEGENIPYQKFGFTSVTALLKSMPDKIKMIGQLSDINSVTLYPVKSEENKHIIDFVQKQSKNKKRSRGRPPFPRFNAPRFNSSSGNPFNTSSNTYRNDIHFTQNDVLNAQKLNNTLINDLFVAYYKYFEGLSRTPYLTLDQLIDYTNFQQNISQYLRSDVIQNKPAFSWGQQGLLPTPATQLSNGWTPVSSSGGYTPRTVINYSNQSTILTNSAANNTSNISSNVTSLGEKFLNFRISRTLNRQSEQSSDPESSFETRSVINPNHLSNGFIPLSSLSSTVASNSSNHNSIPNEIKEKIRLMMSSPDIEEGFMLFNFEARYRHQFKESFEYKKYGFESLSDCLQRMPDVLEMIPTGTKTYKLMPLKKSIAQPKPQPKTKVITNGESIAVITSTATTTTVTLVSAHSTTTTTNTIVSTIPKRTFIIPKKSPKREPKPVIPSPIASPPKSLADWTKSLTKSQKSLNSFDDNQSICSSASNLNEKAKQNFRTVLLFHENGINALDFAQEYEKYHKVKFDPRIWGYRSAMELFHGLPQIFSIEVNDKNEEILHDKRFKTFEIKPKKANKIDMNSLYLSRQIPDVVFARILRLIQNRGVFGVSLNEFETIYDRYYDSIGSTLRQLRFDDSYHLFEVIKNEIPVVVREVDGLQRVFIRSSEELSSWTVRQCRAGRYIIPITLVDTPSNVVLPGEQFIAPQLPERFKPGNYEYVALYISSAVNPHEIYVQFKGAQYHTALEELMFRLDFYDTVPEDQWAVPFEFLYVGYPVVCRYPGDKNWHRARITRIHASDKRLVTVSFVDYGGTHVLDYKNLRLMRREFLTLPIQALKVGLYGIKPILGNKPSDWTASARDKLLRFSKPQYALACTLIEVTPENHWVAVCDTNTALDVFLHLVLINDKHALHCDDDTPVDDSPQQNTNRINGYSHRPIAQNNGF